MNIKELTIEQFTNFQIKHSLSNFYQTLNYALLMAENGYDYDLIGLVDKNNTILAASLILIKSIGLKDSYGYAPRGFLLDYSNFELLNTFTKKIKEYYLNKHVSFIKLNPNLAIGQINNKTYLTEYNNNKDIISKLEKLDYKKLKDNLYFESQLPRFNAFINLKTFDLKKINKNNRNKINKGLRKGLILEKYDKDKLNIFYNFIKKQNQFNEFYYTDLYTTFSKNNNIDLFLVSIDYKEFLKNSSMFYDIEVEKNTLLNKKIIHNKSPKVINDKMNSDRKVLLYKNEIMEATHNLNDTNKVYIAGALVIKHNKMVSIIANGYDSNYKRFAPNYFLHYSIIKYYQNDYDYLDLNGFTGDFTKNNPYYGLNQFKFGFNPLLYEFMGEFDLIINEKNYYNLLYLNILTKEFDKDN